MYDVPTTKSVTAQSEVDKVADIVELLGQTNDIFTDTLWISEKDALRAWHETVVARKFKYLDLP